MKRSTKRRVVAIFIISCFFWSFAIPQVCFGQTPGQNVALALSAREVMIGFEDGSMGWEETLTRAQAVKIIVLAMGLGEQIKQSQSLIQSFPDVGADHWAFGVINLGTELEIVKGFPDGTFKPDKPVTKAEYAVMLWRMYRGLGGIPQSEIEVPPIEPSWAASEIKGSSDLIQVLNLKEGDSLEYQITRGEIGSITYSLMERFGLLYDIKGEITEVNRGSILLRDYNSDQIVTIKMGADAKCIQGEEQISISPDLVGKEAGIILNRLRVCALISIE